MQSETAVPDPIAQLVQRVLASQLPSPSVRRSTREAAGLSLRDVAGALGVDAMTVQHWEQGLTRPRPQHAAAYRRLLDALRSAGA